MHPLLTNLIEHNTVQYMQLKLKTSTSCHRQTENSAVTDNATTALPFIKLYC